MKGSALLIIHHSAFITHHLSLMTDRVVIIGAGHNGLVAACYLAKAGLAPLVLERREVVGGVAVTEEFHRGFLCPAVLHGAGPLLPKIAAELQLEKHGSNGPAPCRTAGQRKPRWNSSV